jgi:hypothetical protein
MRGVATDEACRAATPIPRVLSMETSSLLLELFGRIQPLAADVVDGLDAEQLCQPPAPGANPIGWLVWHLTRVEDHHVAEVLGTEQIWMSGDWARRCGLEPDPSDTGYGHGTDDVLAVRPEGPDVLIGYLAEVDGRTKSMLEGLTADDLDRVVDRRWDPPVTLGVRLVSIADDSLEHLGQAAYVRGLLKF